MLWASPAFAAMDNSVEVWKSATCTCCGNWVKHLEANDFVPTVHAAEPAALAEIKRQAGIGTKLASCHTAKIDGYVIEGHVPARTSSGLYPSIPMLSDLRFPACRSALPEWSEAPRASPTTCCSSDETARRKYSRTTSASGL
jgi:hypothetical protein